MSTTFDSIPDIPTLETRFAFIELENTRQNITVCFQYIIFLTIINETDSRDGPIKLSLYRDIVVHTASILDACLHYGVTRLVAEGRVSRDTLDKSWQVDRHRVVHKISDDYLIIGARKIREPKSLRDNPSSKEINAAALTAELITQDLYQKVEDIREMRNNIHFNGEEKQVMYPTKDDIERIFAEANDVITSIENRLKLKDR